MERLAAVSVDLDEIDCYADIHGLESDRANGMGAVYQRGLVRLSELFDELQIPATFFAIGRDVTGEANAAQLRGLHARGHEIANHSLSHLYDLTRKPRKVQEREILGGADAIEAAVGVRPVGFRAPGYTVTDSVIDILTRAHFLYDSSLFPCPAYYAAKAATIGLISLRGRKSRSIVDAPRVPFGPAQPFRTGKPYYRPGSGLLELPIGVTGNASGRLPFIGTSVVCLGAGLAGLLTRLAMARGFVSLELHGIDLCDADEDGLHWLRPHQPDLRRSLEQKRRALMTAIRTMQRAGYRFVTLAEAARIHGAKLRGQALGAAQMPA